ncbi:Mv-ORF43 peptide [Maruca vitrata nucleopolyhedrovirus]|uniref:Mv-ORF43 peptide n=1 Tax=Maruca vitrata nucleopolyhedrovirus TaxID=1307954 RepID=A1YRA5_9ABAC|nr:Mv-ORF43 peptide [Maruca vitrata nucleopolyhedrovirus]ABL75995.1 Mv-ORF43 peptide [Maruca vitrata nucleopolyhedrovirus]
MYQIPDLLYNEKMPSRAKKLFVETFTKYHKMNGGDEDIAMRKAKKALEEKYVKVDTLQNSWIPRKAAYEIVRDDVDESDDNADNFTKTNDRFVENNNENTSTDYDTEDDERRVNTFNNRKRRVAKQSKSKFPIASTRKRLKRTLPRYDTSEDEDDEYNYNY